MSAGTFRLEGSGMSTRERERIRQTCIEKGVLDEDDMLDLDDIRIFTG